MMGKRPLGIWILVIFLLLLILYNWIPNKIILKSIPDIPAHFNLIRERNSPFLGTHIIFQVSNIFRLLITTIIFLGGIIFVVFLKNWGRLLIIYSCSIITIINIYAFIVGYPTTSLQIATLSTKIKEPVAWYIQTGVFNLLVYLLPIIYLSIPKVKEKFK